MPSSRADATADNTPTALPFGAWRSPISANMLTSAVRSFGALGVNASGLWWCEARPDEGGRTTLLRRAFNGDQQELLESPWSTRSRVHEYGGGAVLAADEDFYFVHAADQQIYRVRGGAAPQRLTNATNTRFADCALDARRNRLIAVAEISANKDVEPQNLLVGVQLDTGHVQPIVTGADFFASPRISPDGTQLCWLQWRHPHMPWDAAQLHVCALSATGEPAQVRAITRPDTEAAFQPEWLPDGRLVFINDRSGWWNPWLWDGRDARPVLQESAEYGLPLWGLGARSFCVLDGHRMVAQRLLDGAAELVEIDLNTGTLRVLPSRWQRFGQLCATPGATSGATPGASSGAPPGATPGATSGATSGASAGATANRVWFVGERHDCAAALVEYNLDDGHEAVIEGGDQIVAAANLSAPARVAFSGDRGERTYAWFYAPLNAAHVALDDRPPPLMVLTHGGPTGATSPALNLRIQYFTTRGWAVVDVDYSGSTGYGRAYRERLRGRWGIADVADVVAVVQHLATNGRIDSTRVAIRGGSAGGYTTLAALAFTDSFHAGVSYYGIGDLSALARDTHKFESRYTDQLIAPWPAAEDVYRARSPIHNLDGFHCPAIFLQGGEDKVVPPNQAEQMAAALRDRGVPVAHVVFPDEGHGFRHGANVRRAIALEYTFLARVFGFTPAEPMEPLHIDNLTEQHS